MKIKKISVEKGLVAFMFVLVLTVFSLAQRDTEKLIEFYTAGSSVRISGKENKLIALASPEISFNKQ